MTLTELLVELTVLAERVNHADRRIVFEAMRRLRHGGSYVVSDRLALTEHGRRGSSTAVKHETAE